MEVSPLRALTQVKKISTHVIHPFVEMEVSPLRALTHLRIISLQKSQTHRRNGSKLVEGIDTTSSLTSSS